MAFKYPGRTKFDDANKDVEQAPRKLYNAFPNEAIRRAIQGITNRVLDGDFGTAGTTAAGRASASLTGCQTGGTGGIGVAKPVAVIINGRVGTRASAGSYWLPAGTQGASTYVKYGIFGGFGTSGTVLAGNESDDATGAYLPDCPDGYVCLGYMQYAAGTSDWNRNENKVTGQTGSSGTATFVDLVHMPLYET